jgi:hypothetical protein
VTVGSGDDGKSIPIVLDESKWPVGESLRRERPCQCNSICILVPTRHRELVPTHSPTHSLYTNS